MSQRKSHEAGEINLMHVHLTNRRILTGAIEFVHTCKELESP